MLIFYLVLLSDQFVCGDRQTIVDNKKRCDGVPDCPKTYRVTISGYEEVVEDELMEDCLEDGRCYRNHCKSPSKRNVVLRGPYSLLY